MAHPAGLSLLAWFRGGKQRKQPAHAGSGAPMGLRRQVKPRRLSLQASCFRTRQDCCCSRRQLTSWERSFLMFTLQVLPRALPEPPHPDSPQLPSEREDPVGGRSPQPSSFRLSNFLCTADLPLSHLLSKLSMTSLKRLSQVQQGSKSCWVLKGKFSLAIDFGRL